MKLHLPQPDLLFLTSSSTCAISTFDGAESCTRDSVYSYSAASSCNVSQQMNVTGAMARAILIHSFSNVRAQPCVVCKARPASPMVSVVETMVNTGDGHAHRILGSRTSARLYVRTGYVCDRVHSGSSNLSLTETVRDKTSR